MAGDADSLSKDKQAESEEEEEGRAPNSPGNPSSTQRGGNTLSPSPLPPSQSHSIALLPGKIPPKPSVPPGWGQVRSAGQHELIPGRRFPG